MMQLRDRIRSQLPFPIKAGIRYSRRLLRSVFCNEQFISPDVSIKGLQRLGNDDGDWVVADCFLHSGSVVYSVGLGDNISFDLALIERYRCLVFGFDPTPLALSYLAGRGLPSQLRVFPLGLATFDGKKNFGAPVESGVQSFSSRHTGRTCALDVCKLSSLMSKSGHSKIDLLKMDIEGDEYGVITQMVEEGISPTQLLVEFHHGFYGIPFSQTQQALASLRKAGYSIFNVSPTGREFSLISTRASAMEGAGI